jgi:hypothetical protein
MHTHTSQNVPLHAHYPREENVSHLPGGTISRGSVCTLVQCMMTHLQLCVILPDSVRMTGRSRTCLSHRRPQPAAVETRPPECCRHPSLLDGATDVLMNKGSSLIKLLLCTRARSTPFPSSSELVSRQQNRNFGSTLHNRSIHGPCVMCHK